MRGQRRITSPAISSSLLQPVPVVSFSSHGLSRRAIEWPVHGTSSCTRTSGGRLNLGLATTPRQIASLVQAAVRQTVSRCSHSLTSVLAVALSLSLSLFLSFSLLLSPFLRTYRKRRKRRGEEGRNEECTYTRPAVRPAGWLAGLQGRQRQGKTR